MRRHSIPLIAALACALTLSPAVLAAFTVDMNGVTPSQAAVSCQAINTTYRLPSGVYNLVINSATTGGVYEAYCNMTAAGGIEVTTSGLLSSLPAKSCMMLKLYIPSALSSRRYVTINNNTVMTDCNPGRYGVTADAPGASCDDINKVNSLAAQSGVYYINVLGTTIPTYCLMSNTRGLTLLARISSWDSIDRNGAGEWGFDSPHWYSNSTINPTDVGLDSDRNLKNLAFSALPISRTVFHMVSGSGTAPLSPALPVIEFTNNPSAQYAKDFFNAGLQVPTNRAMFTNVMANFAPADLITVSSQSTPGCNSMGFNIGNTNINSVCRMGLLMTESTCSVDTKGFVGLGCNFGPGPSKFSAGFYYSYLGRFDKVYARGYIFGIQSLFF